MLRQDSRYVRTARRARCLEVVLALWLIGAAQARADPIYWTDSGSVGPHANEIGRINSDGTGRVTLVSGLHQPNGIALDLLGKQVYWVDTQTGDIGRANLNDGSNPTILIQNLNLPVGVALDAAANRIYWANAGNDTIGWASLTDNVPHILFHTNGSDPQGVALDVKGGKIYWTDFGSGAIESGNLDGSGRTKTLISGLNIGLGGPDGLALDLQHGQIYWANGGGIAFGTLGFIGRVNLDGSDFQELVSAVAPIGVGLDLNLGKMYWGTLSSNEDLEVANLDGSGKTSFLAGLNGPSFPTADPTPEPSAMILAALGAGLLVLARIRGPSAPP